MARISSLLEDKISDDPDQPLNVIIRVSGDLSERLDALEEQGFHLRRRLSLIKGLAGTATGSAIRKFATQPWVMSIEEDQQVRTM